jgi:hypothetical protein
MENQVANDESDRILWTPSMAHSIQPDKKERRDRLRFWGEYRVAGVNVWEND